MPRSSRRTPKRRGWPAIRAASTRSASSPAPASRSTGFAPRPAVRWSSPEPRADAPNTPRIRTGRTRLIAVSASFAGIGLFVALFVVTGTMALAIQLREQEIALLRAVAATPGQIRRMIAWEATIVALIGSAAGIWPGAKLAHALADGLVRHGIAPPNFALGAGRLRGGGSPRRRRGDRAAVGPRRRTSRFARVADARARKRSRRAPRRRVGAHDRRTHRDRGSHPALLGGIHDAARRRPRRRRRR